MKSAKNIFASHPWSWQFCTISWTSPDSVGSSLSPRERDSMWVPFDPTYSQCSSLTLCSQSVPGFLTSPPHSVQSPESGSEFVVTDLGDSFPADQTTSGTETTRSENQTVSASFKTQTTTYSLLCNNYLASLCFVSQVGTWQVLVYDWLQDKRKAFFFGLLLVPFTLNFTLIWVKILWIIHHRNLPHLLSKSFPISFEKEAAKIKREREAYPIWFSFVVVKPSYQE